VEAILDAVQLAQLRLYSANGVLGLRARLCYMLIQILQSKGQLLTSGARPVAEGLGRAEEEEMQSLEKNGTCDVVRLPK
jgi:hypothetical protein